MAKKASGPPKIAPPQYIVAVPITDPAEQAALDEMRKRVKKKQGRKGTKKNREDAEGGSSDVKKPSG